MRRGRDKEKGRRGKTYLSTTVPRSWRPGRISRSGTEVSTMVETSAIQTSLAATLCEADTAAM